MRVAVTGQNRKVKTERKKTIINKLRDSGAFTLAEALVATIILLLVSVIMITGIPAAINAYNNVVIASNSEALLSTMSALRNELATAKDIRVESDQEISYYNPAISARSKIRCSGTDIMLQRYAVDETLGNEGSDEVRLVSEAASDKDKQLHIVFDEVQYDSDSGVVTFSSLNVNRKDNTPTNTGAPVYSIRVISEGRKTHNS